MVQNQNKFQVLIKKLKLEGKDTHRGIKSCKLKRT